MVIETVRFDKKQDLFIEAVRREKVFGVSTTRVDSETNAQFQAFAHPWILVEEISGNYRAILAKEYKLNQVPKIYLDHSSRTVFAPNSTAGVEDDENINVAMLPNSNASGLNGLSTAAPNARNSLGAKEIRKICGGPNRLDVESPLVIEVDEGPLKKKQKKSEQHQYYGCGFYDRPGFCENCNVKYLSYNSVSLL